jgi:hypothetical protein
MPLRKTLMRPISAMLRPALQLDWLISTFKGGRQNLRKNPYG